MALPLVGQELAASGDGRRAAVGRLRTRFDRRADIAEAFLSIAQSLICFRTLQTAFC